MNRNYYIMLLLSAANAACAVGLLTSDWVAAFNAGVALVLFGQVIVGDRE